MEMVIGALFFLSIGGGVILAFTSPLTGLNPGIIAIGTIVLVVLEIIATLVIAKFIDNSARESECSDEEYAEIVRKDFENDNIIKFSSRSSK